MDIIIPIEYENRPLKLFLQKELDLSQKMITRLKALPDGMVLNGTRVTVRAVLHNGDRLYLNTEHEARTSDAIEAVRMPLDILFEDEHYIVLNKPSNMPTHPSHDHYGDTLANGIAYLYRERNEKFVFRAVNRLDRDTSGIVVFAKSAPAAYRFSLLQQNKLITKKYLAIAVGALQGSGSITGYIKRKENSIMLRELSEREDEGGAYSRTDYRSLATAQDCSLLELILHTGRTHQIRVHLSSISHPVLGDGLYGSEDGYRRHMLHAYKMSFIHPFTEKRISLSATIPPDFSEVMKKKGISYDDF